MSREVLAEPEEPCQSVTQAKLIHSRLSKLQAAAVAKSSCRDVSLPLPSLTEKPLRFQGVSRNSVKKSVYTAWLVRTQTAHCLDDTI